jgi:LPS-assembly protein
VLSLICSATHAATVAAASAVEETEAILEADSLFGQKNRQLEAKGDATLRQNGKSIRADRILYSPAEREVDAQGNVVLEQQNDRISGPRLHMNMGTGQGVVEQPQFHFQENNGRAAAISMDIQDKQHYELRDATYTTCPAGNNDWQLNMDRLEIDRATAIGTAHGTSVEFKGVPFLYTPWMNFPLNDHRKSGLLSPTYGSTSKGGMDLTIPYYWNIAPEMDATLAPRIMLKRGVQLNNEFRYMGATYNGELHGDVLPNDQILKRSRAHFSVRHGQALGYGFVGFLNFNRVTDDAYFRDLGTAVNSSAQVNLLQEGGFNLSQSGWNSTVRVQRYQTLQDPVAPIVAPYARMPQLTTSAVRFWGDTSAAMGAEYVEFSHPTLINGKRMMLNPSASYALVNQPGVYVTPKIALHSTHYSMGVNNLTGMPNASRTLPLFSLDSGLFFERDTEYFGAAYLQTLEPRAYYVYVPYRNQNNLPNFDTAQADFSFTQMFTENRFFGNDRIGDANQLTLATTSRVLSSEQGEERFKVTLGERFSFINPQVNLLTPTATTSKSDILLAVGGRLSKTMSFDSETDFDPNQSKTQRYGWIAHYKPEPGKTFNFGYRFQRNAVRQADISAQWPLSSRWGTVARMNYSFQDKRILDSIAGLEYNQSCWTLRLIAQHYTTSTLQTNTGFFVQLELSDLMQVGSDPLMVLKQNIPGYTKLKTNPAQPATQVTP